MKFSHLYRKLWNILLFSKYFVTNKTIMWYNWTTSLLSAHLIVPSISNRLSLMCIHIHTYIHFRLKRFAENSSRHLSKSLHNLIDWTMKGYKIMYNTLSLYSYTYFVSPSADRLICRVIFQRMKNDIIIINYCISRFFSATFTRTTYNIILAHRCRPLC